MMLATYSFIVPDTRGLENRENNTTITFYTVTVLLLIPSQQEGLQDIIQEEETEENNHQGALCTMGNICLFVRRVY